jgi:hypothetical protein
MIADTRRDRLVTFGGSGPMGEWMNDVWQLSLSGDTPAWHMLNPAGTPPSPRGDLASAYDPAADRAMFYGGDEGPSTAPVFSSETWRLDFGTTADAPEDAASVQGPAIAGLSPNPCASACRVSFALPAAGRAVLEVIDASGRRVLARSLGVLQPGGHNASIALGADARAGLYFVRISQGTATAVAKLAHVR